MTELEILENEAASENINVINYIFSSNRIKGLYCDKTVALSTSLDTDTEKKCILAEELGHYHTTTGNILDQADISNRKQELHARAWAYDKMIGLIGIISAYKRGCRSKHDIAEFLEITEDFLSEALQYYKSKYGIYTKINNYVIYFEPALGILELK